MTHNEFASWKILLRVLVGLSWSKFESMTCNLKKNNPFLCLTFSSQVCQDLEQRNKKQET